MNISVFSIIATSCQKASTSLVVSSLAILLEVLLSMWGKLLLRIMGLLVLTVILRCLLVYCSSWLLLPTIVLILLWLSDIWHLLILLQVLLHQFIVETLWVWISHGLFRDQSTPLVHWSAELIILLLSYWSGSVLCVRRRVVVILWLTILTVPLLVLCNRRLWNWITVLIEFSSKRIIFLAYLIALWLSS